ncbi:hypothetical protein A5792_28510 [Mycolicibacterium peregrinum]|uniref:Methionyl-tRNA formyltransferase n=1 Tax=Mycolicibacterium peregrinum TaxID=43304 RepID=A0A1A0QT11_MYCPR|nr:hypothetical protein A5792_28510 [Mycolicibacterium peregrinum]
MAYIGEFTSVPSSTHSLHKPVLCGWRTFDVDGTRILQLDTYGSEARQIPGKVSQTIQIDGARAAELVHLIKEIFPGN